MTYNGDIDVCNAQKACVLQKEEIIIQHLFTANVPYWDKSLIL